MINCVLRGCRDTFAVTGNLVIYSNQYSNSLCLKSCKLCLNGAVRAFHLAALGPHPCCKGQLSKARTIREIKQLTQLEPRLQRLCACSWLWLQWHWCDIRDRAKGAAGGRGCPAARYPTKVPPTLPAACGEEPACTGASSTGCTQHRALTEGLGGLVSCYPTAFSLHWW